MKVTVAWLLKHLDRILLCSNCGQHNHKHNAHCITCGHSYEYLKDFDREAYAKLLNSYDSHHTFIV